MTVEQTPLAPGSVVIHPQRPEWGRGVVESVSSFTHEGRLTQRVVVRFTQRGRVTLNSAVARLVIQGNQSTMNKPDNTSQASTNGGWLASLEVNNKPAPLWTLPEALTDPFSSLFRRVTATLDTYRFSNEPRSLIEWAIAQTGFVDPLSHHTRHELELGFQRFARDRDNHLLDLVRQMKQKAQHDQLVEILGNTRLETARTALQRAMRA